MRQWTDKERELIEKWERAMDRCDRAQDRAEEYLAKIIEQQRTIAALTEALNAK